MNQHTIGRRVAIAIIIGMLLLTMAGKRTARATTVSIQTIHCGGWSIVPSPNATSFMNQLNAVAAISPTDVWAIGIGVAPNSPTVALIEHWDGTKWSLVSSPDAGAFLFGVTAVSATNVWAVGVDPTGTVIEHWDGISWQLVKSPSVDGIFLGVSAQSATDIWAVGELFNGDLLTEHWDGSTWQVVPAPGVPNKSSKFNSVSVLSPTDAWAVGSYIGHGSHAESYSLSEHWDGTAWHIVPTPNVGKFSPLNAVVALSSSNVWAVGNVIDSTLDEHWDGQQWHVVSPSLNGQNHSVAAVSATDIWAVGAALVHFKDQTFTEQWNGSQWQHVRSPNVTANTLSSSYDNLLLGVSASSAHNIWAVGYYAPEYGSTTYTLIEHYC